MHAQPEPCATGQLLHIFPSHKDGPAFSPAFGTILMLTSTIQITAYEPGLLYAGMSSHRSVGLNRMQVQILTAASTFVKVSWNSTIYIFLSQR